LVALLLGGAVIAWFVGGSLRNWLRTASTAESGVRGATVLRLGT
jgi:hypothetical protein